MYTDALKLVAQFGYARITKYASPVGRQPAATPHLLEALLTGKDTSKFSAIQIEIGNEAVARINNAVEAGESVANSYLVNRYNMPLSNVLIKSNEDALRTYTNCIVRYELSTHKSVDAITDKYNDAIAWFDNVSKNGLPIDLSEDPPVQGINDTLSIKQTESSILWERF
jgi:phage gp36-like protein